MRGGRRGVPLKASKKTWSMALTLHPRYRAEKYTPWPPRPSSATTSKTARPLSLRGPLSTLTSTTLPTAKS